MLSLGAAAVGCYNLFNTSEEKLLLVLIPLSVLIVLAALFIYFKLGSTETPSSSKTLKKVTEKESDAVKAGKILSNNQCKGTEKRKLGTSPMKPEDFSMVLPYGLMIGGHVTPIDHQYFSPTIFHSPRDTYEVRAMTDATITDISERTNERGTEYRFVFTISCTLFYYYDLVTSLAPDIKAIYDQPREGPFRKALNIPVREGQLVGKIGGQTLDFAVWDTEKPFKGFIVPDHYKGEAWKIYTADPLDYYTQDLMQLILSKYVRTVPPVSGKIDYDIDGWAVGNWFLEGSGGYAPDHPTADYYKTHLAIVYDGYDSTSVTLSIGSYPGSPSWSPLRGTLSQPLQFGVKGNIPDPKDITPATGLVKYELVQKDWVVAATGQPWDRFNLVKGVKAKNHEERVEGVALIQLISDRKIKAEVFPGKVASQVSGFTPNAKIYER